MRRPSCAKSALTDSGSVTSVGTASTRDAGAPDCAAVSSSCACRRPASTTRNPSPSSPIDTRPSDAAARAGHEGDLLISDPLIMTSADVDSTSGTSGSRLRGQARRFASLADWLPRQPASHSALSLRCASRLPGPGRLSALARGYHTSCPSASSRSRAGSRAPTRRSAAGILVSRLAGLLRVRLIARYFGQNSIAVDAFNAAFRIPNLLQNLFGEGALSGSFIPVHSALRARGEHEAAAHTARAFFALLLAGDRRPGAARRPRGPCARGSRRARVRGRQAGAGRAAGADPLSRRRHPRRFRMVPRRPQQPRPLPACLHGAGGVERRDDRHAASLWRTSGSRFARDLPGLGIRGGERAPVRGSGATGVAADAARPRARHHAARAAGRPQLHAGAGQPRSRAAHRLHRHHDRQPAADRRGHGTDQRADSLHAAGQSVRNRDLGVRAARDVGRRGARLARRAARYDALSRRIDAALQRMAFFVVPSAVAFAALGDVIAGVLLQTGRFTATDSRYVWGILAGSSIGLLATTMARLYSVAHYAVGDTKSPLRFAAIRLIAATVLGYLCAIVAAAVPANRAALGRRRTDGLSRSGRLDRVRAAAREPQSSCRHHGARQAPTRRGSGLRPSWREPWRLRSGACSRRSTRSSPAGSCCRSMVWCISEARR